MVLLSWGFVALFNCIGLAHTYHCWTLTICRVLRRMKINVGLLQVLQNLKTHAEQDVCLKNNTIRRVRVSRTPSRGREWFVLELLGNLCGRESTGPRHWRMSRTWTCAVRTCGERAGGMWISCGGRKTPVTPAFLPPHQPLLLHALYSPSHHLNIIC